MLEDLDARIENTKERIKKLKEAGAPPEVLDTEEAYLRSLEKRKAQRN
jgi:hypothetical protein